MSVSPALLVSFNIYELLTVIFFWLTRARVHITFPTSVPPVLFYRELLSLSKLHNISFKLSGKLLTMVSTCDLDWDK